MSDEDNQNDKSLIHGYTGDNHLIPFDASLPKGMEDLRQARVYENKSLEKLAKHLSECEWFFQKAAGYLRPLYEDGLPGLLVPNRTSHPFYVGQKRCLDLNVYSGQNKYLRWLHRVFYGNPDDPQNGDILFWMGNRLFYSIKNYSAEGVPDYSSNVIFARNHKDGQDHILVKADQHMTWQNYSQRLLHDFQTGRRELCFIVEFINDISSIGKSISKFAEDIKKNRENRDKLLEELTGPSLDV